MKLICWHISSYTGIIKEFIPSDRGIYGPGIYTTTNFEKIKKHKLDHKSKRFNGRIYKLNVTLRNPLTNFLMSDGSDYRELLGSFISIHGPVEGGEMAVSYAIDKGYDGIIAEASDTTQIVLPFRNDSVEIIANNFELLGVK